MAQEGGASRRSARRSLIGAAVWGLVACGGTSGDVAIAGALDDLAADARASGYEEQAVVLERGAVSEDDLLTAVARARECVLDLGFEVSEISRDSRGTLSYTFTVPDDDNVDANVATADQCQVEYSVLVEQGYDRLHPVDEAPAVADILTCVTSAGLDVDPSIDTLREVQSEASASPGSPWETCYVDVMSAQTSVLR